MAAVYPAFVAVFVGLLLGLTIVAAVEMAAMRLLDIADSPKNIWYPVLANLITFLGIMLGAGLFAVLIAAGLMVATGSGYDSAEWLINGAYAAPLLIPVVAVIVRFALFRLMKLGKAGKAAGYAIASGIVSVVGTLLVTTVFYGAASLGGLV